MRRHQAGSGAVAIPGLGLALRHSVSAGPSGTRTRPSKGRAQPLQAHDRPAAAAHGPQRAARPPPPLPGPRQSLPALPPRAGPAPRRPRSHTPRPGPPGDSALGHRTAGGEGTDRAARAGTGRWTRAAPRPGGRPAPSKGARGDERVGAASQTSLRPSPCLLLEIDDALHWAIALQHAHGLRRHNSLRHAEVLVPRTATETTDAAGDYDANQHQVSATTL